MEPKIRDKELCKKHFTQFYKCLSIWFPKPYYPWFFKCSKNGKDPIKGISWKSRGALLNYKQCMQAIEDGYNIGIAARSFDKLVILDIDNPIYLEQMPGKSLVNTSRKRCGLHGFFWANDDKVKMNLPTDKDGEMRCVDQYVLAPGSFVPVDEKTFVKLTPEAQADPMLGYYTVKNAMAARPIIFDELPEIFKIQYQKNIEKEKKEKPKTEYKPNKFGKSALFSLKISDIVGSMDSSKRIGHPLHESETDANFSLIGDGTLGVCWRHMVTLNAVQFLAVKAGYGSCKDVGTPFKKRRK